MSPSSKEDFTEFERLLKEKISPYEKSIHYSSFLETLFRDLCLSCKYAPFLIVLHLFSMLITHDSNRFCSGS